MISIFCPTEIKIPVKGYSGIEKIAYELFLAMKKMNIDVICLGNVDEETDDMKKLNYYTIFMGDKVIDFTHQKYYAPFFNKTNYMAIVFHTDNVSYVNDVYPTHAVRNAYAKISDGPVIYPGIDTSKYIYRENKEDYLLFLGRLSMIKRPDIAIEVAEKLNTELVIAGHAGIFARYPSSEYVDKIIEKAKKSPKIRLILDPDDSLKAELLSRAKALIVPSDWSSINSFESFGIVAVEALLSGTPVLTSGDGGLKEIVNEKVGFICKTVDDYVKAYGKINEIDPKECRRHGLYFSSERYAKDLLKLWEINSQ